MSSLTAQDIEIAVANHFDYRRNLIVPNVHWGLGLSYECDLVVLRPSNWGFEVEIKISRSDIKADLRKFHKHDCKLFRELYFAVPAALADDANIPVRAGILSVSPDDYGRLRVETVRPAERRRDATKWEPRYRTALYRLAAMRTWTLKQHLSNTRRKST